MGSCKEIERRQLDDRLDAVFKEHWQNYDTAWLRFKETGANWHCAIRQVIDQHAALLKSALPDETFARIHAAEVSVRPIRSKTRKQHHALGFFSFHLVDNALLCVHQRHQLAEHHATNGC